MDRITSVRIRNVRAIEDMRIDLSPLTVLIGENGSGKSTILECLEVLRKASHPSFMEELYEIHRGMPGLLRKGAPQLILSVVVEDDEGRTPKLDYGFSLIPQVAGAVIHRESLSSTGPGQTVPEMVLDRLLDSATILHDHFVKVKVPAESIRSDQLLVGFGSPPPNAAMARILRALRGIEVHPGFDTLASWAADSLQRPASLRGASLLRPAPRLSLLGHNLPSAWHALKNFDDAHWQETLALVRLGLGDGIGSVNTVPDAGGGHVSLSLKRTDLAEPIPASTLSDGQLSWLAFVAIARLDTERSLLGFDEPELHLHPSLLGRVVSLLSELQGPSPVVISTHSERVLGLLDDPADAARVCTLEGGRAGISRLDPRELPRWLEEFGDLGQLRASGYLPRVLTPVLPSNDGGFE